MPAGWWHGRLGVIATLGGVSEEAQSLLAKLLAGDTAAFVLWIGKKTQSLTYAYDQESRDADLETVVTVIQAKLRRTWPFQTPDQSILETPRNSDAPLLFPEEDWNQP
jgi:hypothetical protein